MQYRNIALRGTNMSLVKDLKSSDTWQFYLIQSGLKIGNVILKKSSEKKNIFLEIYINSEDNKKIYEIIDKVIDSLSFYLYDKERIIIDSQNNIDLTTFNCEKYKRKAINEKKKIYIYNNQKNYHLIKTLIDSMQECATNLLDNNSYWSENLNFDYVSYLDDDLTCESQNIYLLEESFYSRKKVKWLLNDTTKNKRSIVFSDDGFISFLKQSNKDDKLSYQITANVTSPGFSMNKSDTEINVGENGYTIYKDKVLVNGDYNKNKSYIYRNRGINSSLELEIKLSDKILDSFNLKFLTLDKMGKVTGYYIFNVDLVNNLYNFTFNSNDNEVDLIPLLKNEDKVLLFNLKRGYLPIEKLEKTMQRIVKIINNYAKNNGLALINYENLRSIEDILNIEDKGINDLKEIKGEILVPLIQNRVIDFLNNRDKQEIKYTTRCRSLKKKENLRN